MSLFEHTAFDNHEKVLFATDPATGLKAILAVHSTARGPAVGGCRMWSYPSSAEAVTDVLRLSQGMSYKNIMADLPIGGGKSVIMKPEAISTVRPCLKPSVVRWKASMASTSPQKMWASLPMTWSRRAAPPVMSWVCLTARATRLR